MVSLPAPPMTTSLLLTLLNVIVSLPPSAVLTDRSEVIVSRPRLANGSTTPALAWLAIDTVA